VSVQKALCWWLFVIGLLSAQAVSAASKARSKSAPRGASTSTQLPLHWRPPGARSHEDGPSKTVFPEQRLNLRFNHQKHVIELGVPCLGCHGRAASSRRSSDSLLPSPTRCDACHGTDHRNLHRVSNDSRKVSQCGFCHLGYQASDGNRVRPNSFPPPNLRFDHQKHLARNIGCAQCHGRVAKLGLATRDQMPRMRGCFRCHQAPAASRGEAKGDCGTCHLSRRGSQLETRFETGKMLPPAWLHGADHGPDWIARHKQVAGANSQLCANCHSERYCVDCHDGRVRPRRIHPGDWLSMHPIAARQNSPNCTSCHRQQSFCLSCHQRAGVTLSGPHANFANRGRFHPPKRQWTDPPRGPRHHAWEAQRNINACVSCHVERDCVVCHGTAAVGGRGSSRIPGVGQGVSPHSVGFRGRCRKALRQNARPCLVCHTPSDPNLQLCR